ncbi:MAG: endo-1,4-beta-xylanase [Micropepsaceae bacterium]
MTFDRRRFLQGASAVAAGFALPGRVFSAEWPRLAAIAAARGLGFGSAFDREIFDDPAWAELLAAQCRIGAIENSLKFDWLRPNGPEADFAVADRLIDFGLKAGLALRGTALIWNDWLPDWLKWSSVKDRRGIFERHIDEVVFRYAGRVTSWDVVNEPFFPMHGREGGYRGGYWFDALGPDYIAQAFRRVAAADPQAELVLNEAFCEHDDPFGVSIRPLLYDCVKRLKDDGVPLHAVGLQGHLKPHLPHDYARFADWVAALAALGVSVKITELDVDDSALPGELPERDAAVAETLRQFLSAVLPVLPLEEVICWQLSDKYSWYGNADWYPKERQARSHLFDVEMRPKRAADAVAAALAASPAR